MEDDEGWMGPGALGQESGERGRGQLSCRKPKPGRWKMVENLGQSGRERFRIMSFSTGMARMRTTLQVFFFNTYPLSNNLYSYISNDKRNPERTTAVPFPFTRNKGGHWSGTWWRPYGEKGRNIGISLVLSSLPTSLHTTMITIRRISRRLWLSLSLFMP